MLFNDPAAELTLLAAPDTVPAAELVLLVAPLTSSSRLPLDEPPEPPPPALPDPLPADEAPLDAPEDVFAL